MTPNLIWPEIRARATQFAKDWKDETSERAEAQTFWNEFFEVFGVKRRRVAVYEKHVTKLPKGGKTEHGRIDVFWPGTLLAEHKSGGHDLAGAFGQALDYFSGLDESELPRFVVVSDFARFRLYDLDQGTDIEFSLVELPKKVHHFGFIAGYRPAVIREDDPLNIKAVQKLGELHDALKSDGYGLDPGGHAGHPLQVFLVRTLFCLFADDTGLFSPKDSFRELVENTREDGSDTGGTLAKLFQVLNQPREQRQKSIAETFSAFPYVNGRLFEEALAIPEFSANMRGLLLECCGIEWSAISPAIFGAMFQKIIELDARDRRRQLGAHYTSEANILKLIGPLFLDELRAEFERVRHNKNALFEFHKKLGTLNFLDPACGCGNFLVITYRELRRLELDVLRAAAVFGPATGHVFEALKVDVDQFHGIEYEEFPAQVAQVAMWLTDHQMNVEAGRELGEYFARIPLTKSANIRLGNALRIDWEEFVPPARLNYILGNPPFVGAMVMNDEQREDVATVMKGVRNAGILDYVSCWYAKAAQYLSGTREGFASRDRRKYDDVRFGLEQGTLGGLFASADDADDAARARIRCAFVSTNSISQGEQVGALWSELQRRGMKIRFAHRTFKWSNEAPGKAAVHCVIIGFGMETVQNKRIFAYLDADGPPFESQAANINPYLVDAPDILLANRDEPICHVPRMRFGSMPRDGGHLILDAVERQKLLNDEPDMAPFVRRYTGAEEFLNGGERWCLWLVGAPPALIAASRIVRARVEATRLFRAASKAAATRKFAATPSLFCQVAQPESDYLLVPRVSSERRKYIPIGFMSREVIGNDQVLLVPDAKPYHLGILSSEMHMSWMRYTCGRLKSDFRYSKDIVYNNFPWPQGLADKHRAAIESAAQSVLDARAGHSDATLAQLYDPNTMPPNLVKAHQALDRAVDAAYLGDGGAKSYATDAERVAFLFRRYEALTSMH